MRAAWLAVLALAVAAPLAAPGGFALTLLGRACVAIVFALAFNLKLGEAGLLDFGHAVPLGLGGFAAAYAMRAALPGPLVPLAGAAGGLAAGLAMGLAASRRGGAAFAMITLGLGELAAIATAALPVFGGEAGIAVDRGAGPVDLGAPWRAYAVIAAWTFASALLMAGFTRTAPGRLARALRDDPVRLGFLGHDPARLRLLLLAVSGLFAGVAGALQLLNEEIVSADALGPGVSASALVMVVLGGTGRFWGPALGAVAITLLSGLLGTVTLAWPLYAGLLFMAAVLWAPGGLAAPRALLPRLPGLALLAAGAVLLAELAEQVQALQRGAAPSALPDPASPLQWAAGAALAAAGLWRLR